MVRKNFVHKIDWRIITKYFSVAPLCYCYDDPIALYFTFRAIYSRFFHHLHCVSSHQHGILSLSLLFERLLQQIEPQLFYHLCSIGVQPLKISFKWIIRAFSGYLCSEQVLLLWDRILAYGSLEILAVLAVAIFSFRKTNLLQIQSYQAAEAVMNDLTGLKVIPLLQLTLFSEWIPCYSIKKCNSCFHSQILEILLSLKF